jgi:hypothetical protein
VCTITDSTVREQGEFCSDYAARREINRPRDKFL